MISANLKFWGIRGSIACGASGIGGNTSCTELAVGDGHSIFFDAGTGIRAAGYRRKFQKVSLFLSHFHWDHIQGLPFFAPLYDDNICIDIYTPYPDCEDRLRVLTDDRFHPVSYEYYKDRWKLHLLEENKTIKVGDFDVSTAVLNHPGRSYAFRLSSLNTSFVYATDTDYQQMSPEAEGLLRGADFAVMDSQFLVGDQIVKWNYGHASYKKAVDVAAHARIKTVYLYSLDPSYDDETLERVRDQATEYSKLQYGSDGPQMELPAEGSGRKIVFC